MLTVLQTALSGCEKKDMLTAPANSYFYIRKVGSSNISPLRMLFYYPPLKTFYIVVVNLSLSHTHTKLLHDKLYSCCGVVSLSSSQLTVI
jgi:hypothetical protein